VAWCKDTASSSKWQSNFLITRIFFSALLYMKKCGSEIRIGYF
jgi:hypothetical protein